MPDLLTPNFWHPFLLQIYSLGLLFLPSYPQSSMWTEPQPNLDENKYTQLDLWTRIAFKHTWNPPYATSFLLLFLIQFWVTYSW